MAPTSSKKSISLWAVVDAMQRKLEGEGLDPNVVDLAVTRGLESLLATPPHDDAPAQLLWLPLDAAKA